MYTNYFNLDTLEAPEYDFIANPLAYIGHQDRLPEAKEVVVGTIVKHQKSKMIIEDC